MASPGLQSILVIGPTGAVGLSILRELIKRRSEFKRIGAFNRTSRSEHEKGFIPVHDEKRKEYFDELEAGGVEIVTGNYEHTDAFEGFDALVLAIGNLGIHLSPRIIDIALAAGVRHFYPSEFGADLAVNDNWTQRYYKHKAITREHLSLRAQEYPDLGWSYIMIGRFTEWSCATYFGVDVKNGTGKIYGNENGRQSLLPVPAAAAYTVSTMLLPIDPGEPKTFRREFRFHGGTYSWSFIFALLEKITDRPFTVQYLPFDGAVEDGRRAKAAGDEKGELQASHRMVQGGEGTVLPQPWDNERFPEVNVEPIEVVLGRAYEDGLLVGVEQ